MRLNKIAFLPVILALFIACKKTDDKRPISLDSFKEAPYYSVIVNNEVLDSAPDYDLNARINGYSALQYLVWNQFVNKNDSENDNIEVFKSFIENGSEIASLFEDEFRQQFDIIGACISEYRNKYLNYILSQIDFELPDLDETGGNYLQLAINCSNSIVIYDLLPYIKNINGTNSKNQTVLHYAAAACIDYEIIEYLLSYGADKTIKDTDGKTACDIYVDYYSTYDENYRLLKEGK
ncbi:ankyrin repeat domain-containing protein [Treponema sp. C6A8]|uniref:ankyrin repeat domain-containing protein n=1 Tax=Treponema sp. C6A8 TaxID=1410609 RepID=UPI00047F4E22|nr:ankyrin repeat domain-containing protein [Treponema sp. C6A8]